MPWRRTFVESISYDNRLYRQDIAGSIAHAKMLSKVGLITEDEEVRIIAGLKLIQKDFAAGKIALDKSQEDIHMVVEAELIRRIGEPGRKLHTARSRNDQVALDLALWVRQSAFEVAKRLHDLCRAFIEMGHRSQDIVMPAYTHMQRAQPIVAAAECLAWCTMFNRDADRCATAGYMTTTNDSPLGSGAVAGSSMPTDPAYTAELLKFDGPPVSSIEQTASRDQALEFLFSLSMTAMHLSRFAEQWVIYSSTEFSFIKIADKYTTGSSMMPQKRNPRHARADPRPVWLRVWRSDGTADNLQGATDRLQPRLAGGQADSVPGLRHSHELRDDGGRDCVDREFREGEYRADARSRVPRCHQSGRVPGNQRDRVPHRPSDRRVAGSRVREERSQGVESAQGRGTSPRLRPRAVPMGPRSARMCTTVWARRNVTKRYKTAGAGGGEPLKKALAEWHKKTYGPRNAQRRGRDFRDRFRLIRGTQNKTADLHVSRFPLFLLDIVYVVHHNRCQ